MGNIFEVKGYRGLKYYCSKKTWEEHVVAGHPMMKDNIPAIIEAVKAPGHIGESHDSDPPLDYREVYSKIVKDATYYDEDSPYTKVIVRIAGGYGEIISAYPAPNPTGGVKDGVLFYNADDEN